LIIRHNLPLLMARKRIKSIKELTRLMDKYEYATLYNFSTYVHKKLDPTLIVDLCDFFNCGIDDLLYLEENKKEGA
jgi:DNA-binding Xre family transcriptional regulator